MSLEKAILLLGRRDEPTDGVADYCEKLSRAGVAHGVSFEIATVGWMEEGWRKALATLQEKASAWRGRWVFLQYTTLAWSSRGFPLRAPEVLAVLSRCGARPAVVFHDFMPVRGSGVVGAVREYCQMRVLRQLYARANLVISTVPAEKISWLSPSPGHAVFIPVGSNIAAIGPAADNADSLPSSAATVAVFGITGDPRGTEEVADITYALKSVHTKGVRVRLVAIGRGSEAYEGQLRRALDGSGIELSVLGLMPPEDLVRALAAAHVLLCVRGHVSSRRGSAIAGIVCGLPIVGYRGDETGFPITEAGIQLVDIGDRDGLAQALSAVLTDPDLYRRLRQSSESAARRYFSWDAIASKFAGAMSGQKRRDLESAVSVS